MVFLGISYAQQDSGEWQNLSSFEVLKDTLLFFSAAVRSQNKSVRPKKVYAEETCGKRQRVCRILVRNS